MQLVVRNSELTSSNYDCKHIDESLSFAIYQCYSEVSEHAEILTFSRRRAGLKEKYDGTGGARRHPYELTQLIESN